MWIPRGSSARMGYLPLKAPKPHQDMTVQDFARCLSHKLGGFLGAEARRRVDDAIGEIHLQPVVGSTIDTLSKGFKRRVGLAQAILHDHGLILDELFGASSTESKARS